MLDDTPITVALSTGQLRDIARAVKALLRKCEREIEADFIPAPGSADQNLVRAAKLREIITTIDDVPTTMTLPAGHLGLTTSAVRLLIRRNDRFGKPEEKNLCAAEEILNAMLEDHRGKEL